MKSDVLRIKRAGSFDLRLKQLIAKNPEILLLINQKIDLFQKNPSDSRLGNHALKRRMKGKFAFSITNDIRIVYKSIGRNMVRFLAIGGHSKVYGRINK